MRCPTPSCAGAATAAPTRASGSRASSAGPGSPIASRTCSPTPTSTPSCWPPRCPSHAEQAVRVLEAGKHCFVEKPLAQSVADAERVVDAQRRSGKVLMVGHLLQYHPGVNKLKEIADSGELGDIRYIYGNRLNLGQLRADENALWSLGAHDVSVVLHLAGEEPYELSARGESYMRAGDRGRRLRLPALPVRPGGPSAPVVARSPQGAPLHGRGLQAHGDVRRHGPRAQDHDLRQGLRRERRGRRGLRRALGRHLVAARARAPSRCAWSASTSWTACATAASRSPARATAWPSCACSRACRLRSTRAAAARRLRPSSARNALRATTASA